LLLPHLFSCIASIARLGLAHSYTVESTHKLQHDYDKILLDRSADMIPLRLLKLLSIAISMK